MRCDLAAANSASARSSAGPISSTRTFRAVSQQRAPADQPHGLMSTRYRLGRWLKIDKDGNLVDDPTGLGINYAAPSFTAACTKRVRR